MIFPYILKSIKQLEKAGADFIVLPCNTLHYLVPKIKENTNLKIIDLVEEVCKKAREFNKIGIIATSKTINDKLYENKGFCVIYPSKEEQEKISEIIIRIIRKESNNYDKEYVLDIINKLKSRGAEKIILACTDISNMFDGLRLEGVLDSQEVLIEAMKGEMKN